MGEPVVVPRSEELTELLQHWREGDRDALERLMPLVYESLRRLARRLMVGERPDHTLEATALLHEAFLRLARGGVPSCDHRARFYAVVGRLMHQVLVDHARAHRAAKRGGGAVRGSLGGREVPVRDRVGDLLLLDEALERLGRLDPRKRRAVELRYLVGLSVDETAAALGVSPATVALDSRLGRAFLARELGGGGAA